MAIYVDAMNVIGSRPDGWWRDREGAVRRLVDDLQAFAGAIDTEVVLVVDGHPADTLPEGTHGDIEVVYAHRRGPDGADHRIVELVEAHPAAHTIEVVTADAELYRRVTALGAQVTGPRTFRSRIEEAT